MNSQIIKNEVFIRGMLVGKYPHDEKTIAVICSRSANKEHSNYQYVTFFGEEKEYVDQLNLCERVVVTANAWIFRDHETKKINSENLRLRGRTIELARDFSKRVFASAGIPIYGLQLQDCVRFTLNGKIAEIRQLNPHRAFILLSVAEEERDGFNLIPLFYSGKGEEDVEDILNEYKKGNIISVKGFVAQKSSKVVQEDGKEIHKYQNTYFITSFLKSEVETDFDGMF